MSLCVFVGWYHGYCIPDEMMMAIVKAHNDMLEMTAGFILTKTTLAHQVFEKLATFNILENQVPVSRTTMSAYYFCQGDQAEKKRGVGKRKRKKCNNKAHEECGRGAQVQKGKKKESKQASETYKSGEFSSSITSIRPMTLGCVISFIRAISRRTAFSMAGLAAR